MRRWLKNTKNGRIIAWTVAQSRKPGLHECDARGSLIVEKAPVDDKDVLALLDAKVAEVESLKFKSEKQEKIIKEYQRLHGPLENQLPEGKSVEDIMEDDTAISAEEKSEQKEQISKLSDAQRKYENMTKKELFAELKNRNINTSVNVGKPALIQKLLDTEI